jgi:hypothetical protein
VTTEFLDSLARALGFDRSLAQRVRREFEDHIQEATAADPTGDRRDAERRAIASCGDPYAIAAEFAAIALARRAKRLAFWLVLALLGVLLAMKGHGAWYVAMQWEIPPQMRPAAMFIGAIARYAFLTAIFIGAASWAYGNRRRLPSIYVLQGYSRHVYRFCFLAGLATTALIVAIVSDLLLATIRLGPLSPSLAFSVPIASIAFEIACVGALVIFIRTLVRLTLATAHLQPS